MNDAKKVIKIRKNSLQRQGALQRENSVSRRGATAVEFAVTFPLIMVLFLGMLVITQAFTLRDTMQHAAYEGVRKGLLLDATSQDCKDAVQEFTDAMRIKGVTTTIVPANISNATKEITVKVEVPLNKNAWAVASFLPDNWVLSSEITLAKGLE